MGHSKCPSSMSTSNNSKMIKIAFYKTFILWNNSLNEFSVESCVSPTLESAYRSGENVLSDERVYGYVIVKIDNDSWTIVNQTVYGVDYTIYENNGSIRIKEGKYSIALV